MLTTTLRSAQGGMAPLAGSLRRTIDKLCLKLKASGVRCRESAASNITLRTTWCANNSPQNCQPARAEPIEKEALRSNNPIPVYCLPTLLLSPPCLASSIICVPVKFNGNVVKWTDWNLPRFEFDSYPTLQRGPGGFLVVNYNLAVHFIPPKKYFLLEIICLLII